MFELMIIFPNHERQKWAPILKTCTLYSYVYTLYMYSYVHGYILHRLTTFTTSSTVFGISLFQDLKNHTKQVHGKLHATIQKLNKAAFLNVSLSIHYQYLTKDSFFLIFFNFCLSLHYAKMKTQP
jgi:hypothetical protein